ERQGLWQEGDVVLLRAGFIEADFLPDDLSPSARPHLEKACAAPLLLLWASEAPRPLVLLSLSHRGPRSGTSMQSCYDPALYYTAELAGRLRPYRRFWLISPSWDRGTYLASFLPWLAQGVGCSLRCSEVQGVVLIERLPQGARARAE